MNLETKYRAQKAQIENLRRKEETSGVADEAVDDAIEAARETLKSYAEAQKR